jgi:NTE family protein
MGSIVGGLYAAGYSGDSIAALVETIEWGFVFGEKISLKDVSIEEKSEFAHYLTELDLINGKPKVRSQLYSDQGIRELFSVLSFPVIDITDFDKLQIPFRAIAVDIVNGNLFVIKDGKLRDAMRSSMSIPGVFKPVERDGTLLVDGGVLNNFPTDIAKEMGADIIIGSDVGGGMAPKEELESLTNLLFQTGMLNSNLLNPANRALCDILLVHKTKENFSSADFYKSEQIYDSGFPALDENMDQLIALSEQLNKYEQRKVTLPHIPPKLEVEKFIYEGISEGHLDLVEARFGLKESEFYDLRDVINGVQRIMGTTLFDNVNFNGHLEDGKVAVTIKGVEHTKHRAKASLHYDDYRGVGIVLNYTGRNILGEASKLLFTVDIAEQPKLRALHQIHLGKKKTTWWRTEFVMEHLRQDLFKSGERIDNVKHQFYYANTQFNFNTNSLNSFIGLGTEYKHTKLFPSTNPDLVDNFLNLRSYYFNHMDAFIHYNFDSMDKKHFATRGSRIYFRGTQSFLSNVKAEYATESIPKVDGSTNGFARANLESEFRIPVSSKSSAIIGASAGFIFENASEPDDVSFKFYGVAGQYNLGGYLQNSRFASHRFNGLYEEELIVTQFMNLDFGLQWSPVKDFFITPHVDIATVGFGDFPDFIENAFSPNGKWEDSAEESLVLSGGALFEYNSILGPVKFDFSWVNEIEKVRIFFGVGFFF